MDAPGTGPLSHGQLSVWRDIEGLPRERWHEANSWSRWPLPDGVDTGAVRAAIGALAARHPSLRTRYDFTDAVSPRQLVVDFDGVETIEGEVAGDLLDEAARLVRRPFSLSRESAWRIRIATRAGRPTDVLFVKHHMTADGWCMDVLEEDFRRFLADPAAAPVATGPLDIAAWQHGPNQDRARAATRAYWEKIFTSGAGVGFPSADPHGSGALRCTVRSLPAFAGATRLAASTGTSVSTVVLAAYTLAVAHVTGVEEMVAQVMSSNRFTPKWRKVVTSMNQWTAAPLAVADDLAEHTARVHHGVLTAHRHGMYDVDSVADLRAQLARQQGSAAYEATCAYNFLTLSDFSGPPSNDPEPVWEQPFSTIGHPCYLWAAEEAGISLTLRLRTKGIERERVAAVMKDMHNRLTAPLS